MNALAEQYPDPTSIRRGIERAQVALGSVAFHASVWEGREGWAGHPVDARRRHGPKALEELGAVIDTLGDLRIALRRALRAEASPTGADEGQADEDDRLPTNGGDLLFNPRVLEDDDEADDDAPIVTQSDSVYLDPAVRAAVRAGCSAAGRTCGKCRRPFDPADTRFDGHAEDRSTPGYCRSCVDRCHEGDSDHRCPICA